VVVTSTGSISNVEEVCELYNINPTPRCTAELLLALYEKDFTDVYGDCSDQPMTAVSSCEGDFAFVIFDAASVYFLAARSASGAQRLFWGTSEDDEELVLLSTDGDGLAEFPAGCLFESRGETTGRLENFTRHSPKRRWVNALPTIDSHGHLRGKPFPILVILRPNCLNWEGKREGERERESFGAVSKSLSST